MFSLDNMLRTQVINYAVKCRIYPTDVQKSFFKIQFGCSRFIYNYSLARVKKAYVRRKEPFSILKTKKFIPPLKKTTRYAFLREVNSQSLQASVLNLGSAFKRFFGKKGGHPKFKKKNGRQSCEVPQNFLLTKSKRGNRFFTIPKLRSAIRIKLHREIVGELRHIVFSMEPDGKYYASLNCRRKEYCVTAHENECKKTGFDLGFINLYKDSDGKEEEAPRFLRCGEKKLVKTQRGLSKKKKASKNREKARLQLAKVHSKIKNKRKDFLHKQSNKIVNENQVIYFETLNMQGMMRNHCLAKSAMDAMLGEFKRQTKYKSKWRNKLFVQIGRFEPSSKLCSNCGTINKDLKLRHRTWVCNVCHASHDRDINAAINIKKIGQDMSKLTPDERITSGCLLARWQPSWLVEAGSGS